MAAKNETEEKKQAPEARAADKNSSVSKNNGANKSDEATKPDSGGKPEKKEEERYTFAHMEKWQRNRLFGSIAAIVLIFGVFLSVTCYQLYADKVDEDYYWEERLQVDSDDVLKVAEYSKNATVVDTAVYLEQVRSVDIKNSQFEVVLTVGYRWEGHNEDIDFTDSDMVRFYKGTIKNMHVVDEFHEGNIHYNQVRYDLVINKQYWTPRFPLESHQMRIYIEPKEGVNEVVLIPNEEESYTNPSLGITGFEMTRFAVGQDIIGYEGNLLNPEFDNYDDSTQYKTEVMTQFEINREGIGLYIKCFIAMYGTTAWILLCLYICTFRRVDPLGMIGAAFFGSVSNIMVGANLVPDALQMGLLEYGNLFGVGIIIAGTSVVISINAIRKERGNEKFAQYYGRIMLIIFMTLVIIGNFALPMTAWLR